MSMSTVAYLRQQWYYHACNHYRNFRTGLPLPRIAGSVSVQQATFGVAIGIKRAVS